MAWEKSMEKSPCTNPPPIAFADSRAPRLRVSETLRKGESVADGAHRLHEAFGQQPGQRVASTTASREIKNVESTLDGRTWTTEHWPAAKRRERIAMQRFADSEHLRFSAYDAARLESRHGRVREETYAELRQRAQQKRSRSESRWRRATKPTQSGSAI